jgi:hypothetical protein
MRIDSPIWTPITEMNNEIHESLLGNLERFRELMLDPVSTNLYYGVDNLAIGVMGENPQTHQNEINSSAIVDSLECLACAIGLERAFNQEYADHAPGYLQRESKLAKVSEETYFGYDAAFEGGFSRSEKIISLTSKMLGLEPFFENPFRGEIGCQTKFGILTTREVHAMYYAWRIQSLLQFVKKRTLLEIGPGMGRSLKLAARMGIKSTGVDLPIGLVGSALYLASTIGEDAIWLSGEKENPKAIVRLLLPQDYFSSSKKYGVILNTDSLTEMSKLVAMEYMEKIFRTGEIFLSVNHEANEFTVTELLENFPKFKKSIRSQYPLRSGYMEEICVYLAAQPTFIRTSALRRDRNLNTRSGPVPRRNLQDC